MMKLFLPGAKLLFLAGGVGTACDLLYKAALFQGVEGQVGSKQGLADGSWTDSNLASGVILAES